MLNIRSLIKIGTLSIGFLLLSVCVAIFSIIICGNFLFTSPTLWAAETGNILYNMGNLYIPAFGMYLHLWCGVFIMILGLVQILPIFRKKKFMFVHRIIGTVVCVFSLLTSIGGNIFIYTTGTVGGINMDIAFSIAGWILFFLALMTYITARTHRIKNHREWALRLWAMIYSSLFYRLSYFFLFICGYSFTNSDDFYRPVDEFLDWWFFVVPLFCMEMYIQIDKFIKNKNTETNLLVNGSDN